MIDSLPENVEEFLRSGSPPLYITFGSMMLFEPCKSKNIELAASAALDAGFRAIIQYEDGVCKAVEIIEKALQKIT